MAYLRLTSRCNMHCLHCGFACNEKGEDMSMETFTNAMKFCDNYEEMISLGGGEPTLHPNFEVMFLRAMAMSRKNNMGDISVVTNGTNKDISMMMLHLHHHGVSVGLSYDQYHDMDMVDTEVFDAYEEKKALWSTGVNREAKTISRNGRGKHIEGAREFCLCEDWVVEPNGDIRQCACDDSPILGNVNGQYKLGQCGCYKEIERD